MKLIKNYFYMEFQGNLRLWLNFGNSIIISSLINASPWPKAPPWLRLIHRLTQVAPRPSIASSVQDRGLKTSSLAAAGVIIEKTGDWYYLEYGSLRMRWDSESTWYLTLHENFKEKDSREYRGLCGNFDSNPLSKYYWRKGVGWSGDIIMGIFFCLG
jgi:hypothetical protein